MGKGSKKRNVDTVATSQSAETFLLHLLQFVEKSTLEITFCGEVHFGNNFSNYSFVIGRSPSCADFNKCC